MDGADRLMHILKKCGYKIAILSGGFTFSGIILKNVLGQIIYMPTNSKLLTENLQGNIWETLLTEKEKQNF
jgi:phosphoserine phosphatase